MNQIARREVKQEIHPGQPEERDVPQPIEPARETEVAAQPMLLVEVQPEEESDREFKAFSAMTPPALLDRVRAGQFKKQFAIWRTLAAKASLPQAGWALFDVLNSDADYLNLVCSRKPL